MTIELTTAQAAALQSAAVGHWLSGWQLRQATRQDERAALQSVRDWQKAEIENVLRTAAQQGEQRNDRH